MSLFIQSVEIPAENVTDQPMVPYEGGTFQDIDVRLTQLSNEDLQEVQEYDEVHEMEQARQLPKLPNLSDDCEL